MAGLSDARPKGLLRRLYDVCMEWLESPYGIYVLFVIAFAESSFFPLPPDVFLIALCMGLPKKSFKYAAVCAVGSTLGGAFGYGLGLWAMESIGQPIVNWYGLSDKYTQVQDLYQKYDALAIFAAGFTPLPYKLFTITAGAFHIDFVKFLGVSLLSRSARFFLVAACLFFFGAPVKRYIDKYFNILSIVFLVLLIAGFVVVKYLL
ncbi:MAG: YqaA family protein [Desulfocapsaceae bacterium]|nr:YqaA family protein [Desulfocapsaceae bacterium]